MKIGVPKEIKIQENRVGLVPASVKELVAHGHEVWVETQAGHGIGVRDEDYQALGAHIATNAKEIFSNAQLIVKVKEPQVIECEMLNENHILFAYLHLASDPKQTALLLKSGCTAIAYETVTDAQGGLPLLTPMSDIAGRMAVQVGAHYLEEPNGGSGILIGGVKGVMGANVVIVGGGSAGHGAIQIAINMGAQVTIIDKSQARLDFLRNSYGEKLNTILATPASLAHAIQHADIVIGAVLVPGAAAPKIITRDMIRSMRKGSVVIDIAIDQGGCMETSKPTTHNAPIYIEENITHYCVTNMPGAVPRTSAFALNHATLPFTLALANKGYQKALLDDPYFLAGLNIIKGQVTYAAVAKDLGYPYLPAIDTLKIK